MGHGQIQVEVHCQHRRLLLMLRLALRAVGDLRGASLLRLRGVDIRGEGSRLIPPTGLFYLHQKPAPFRSIPAQYQLDT